MGRLPVLIVIAGALALLVILILLGRDDRQELRTSLAVAEALSSDTAGYARALRPRTLRFPEDHGPHSRFRTEWWYYTGNLESPDGRHYGYQLTIFRTALRPDTLIADRASESAPASTVAASERNVDASDADDSTWSTGQLFMAHFAVSDPASGRFMTDERFSRGSAGLAGAQADPYRVWLEDWSIQGASADSVRMVAGTDQMAIDLTLIREKPIVLQGNQGLDAKGPEPGNASYYYSMTRLQTDGTLVIDGSTRRVRGLSWMDHEWSTSVLGRDQVGWDWFSLQLDSGRDIMFYRLRNAAGEASPYSGGVIVDDAGAVATLDRDDVELEATDYWTSVETGSRYPVGWTFRIPARGMSLRLEPYLSTQELVHSVTYWEGAVRVSGTETGSGFVELTGYGESESRLSAR